MRSAAATGGNRRVPYACAQKETHLQQFKLANVLLENNEQFLSEPQLLCRPTAPFHTSRHEAGAWVFEGPGQFDFTTFFNALSVRKWREYTVAKRFFLHLEYKGGAFSVAVSRADMFSWDAELVAGSELQVAASEEWQTLEVELPGSQDDVLEAFVLTVADNPVYLRKSYYYTEVDPADVRPVELALCTTTFKKESFIEHNIRLVKEQILTDEGSIARHFTQHVVDNGRTLDVEALQADRVRIHPNDNVGGSGGYARGMIEAMDQTPKATHVLLMDDDVVISPESIKRTYNLLQILNAEHEDWFVSGAMMDLFEPNVRWEDTGFVTFIGDCIPRKERANVCKLHEVMRNELPEKLPEGMDFSDHEQGYAGWWYCVIPMTAIEQYGLPLPVFVRYDDIEYGIRCHAQFMTMNGICLWHPSFPRRYSAAVERYQVMRNQFIGQLATGMAPLSDFEFKLKMTVRLDLKKFNYTDARLALQGFEDFLKGPDFIEQPGLVEQRFMAANRNKEQLLPFEDLRRQADEEGVDLSGISRVRERSDEPRVESRTILERAQDFVTFNGQRIDAGYVRKNTVAFIDVAGWLYPAEEMRRRDTIVAVDLENRKGVIRHLDQKQFREVWDRLNNDLAYYHKNKERLQAEYAAAAPRWTSVPFWRNYLKMDQEQ